MPIVKNVSRAVSQLLQSSGCGCGISIVPVRCIGVSPRQVASDASFHSVSFSESDHPRVLITGQHSYHNCIPSPASQSNSTLPSSLSSEQNNRSKNTLTKKNPNEISWTCGLSCMALESLPHVDLLSIFISEIY